MQTIGNQYIHLNINKTTPSDNTANLVLVVDGFKLGAFSCATYIPSFIASLDSLVSDDTYFYPSMTDELFTDMVFHGDLENSYMFTLEETFDDFMKRCIRTDKKMYFYFKLYSEHFFDYPNITADVPVIKMIPIHEFMDFLQKIKAYFGL